MKTCIWCRKTEINGSFESEAHTIPQSLGGKYICSTVCDECNSFFGSHFQGGPSVETIIKETFNISRARLLGTQKNSTSGKKRKITSIYFDINMKKYKVDLKLAYKFHQGFQEKICRQLKKGLYKMFLEESERQYGNGLDSKFDFIRDFARYDLGDYPVFYFERKVGLILTAKDWIENPQLYFEKDYQPKYLVMEPSFMEFEFIGHVFSIATSRYWQLAFDNYIKETKKAKQQFFKSIREVKQFNDIDLMLSVLN